MSLPEYPPPRYTGEAGEVTAWVRRSDAAPELPMGGGSAAHYLATGRTTGGAFGLYRWDMGPTPSGPSPHFHRSITESFFVLSGTVRRHGGAGWIDAGPGDFLHVPEGGVHGFRNESGEPASMLLLFTPGAPREDYFETLADAARRETMDADDWTEFFLRHDTFWVEGA
ncbi:cupin domain-containing protein [Blastococcus sp. CT_GayMR16]|uniref:cupin domain-containing protein n=1 Tax=Blastococcus sp. CT_GayMR16 TaxID=2559607 RepID=UPI001073F514|nr:cupin domain-containing protein [Blastococcus sp. CT_GayMR16]TFV86853.1 cupin domain-containing protein [Blastococcus sp. CT_GayMR16]